MSTRVVALAFAVGALAPAVTAWAAPADEPAVRVNTPRGAPIDVIEQRPPGTGRFPVVILASSGAGYHMRLPVLARVAHALVAAAGIGVYRFDWAYRVRDPEKGRFSGDRAAEVEDLNTVLGLARRAPWVDKRGSRSAASRSARSSREGACCETRQDVKVRSCRRRSARQDHRPLLPTEDNYPDVAGESRPTVWLLGNSDPVCVPGDPLPPSRGREARADRRAPRRPFLSRPTRVRCDRQRAARRRRSNAGSVFRASSLSTLPTTLLAPARPPRPRRPSTRQLRRPRQRVTDRTARRAPRDQIPVQSGGPPQSYLTSAICQPAALQ